MAGRGPRARRSGSSGSATGSTSAGAAPSSGASGIEIGDDVTFAPDVYVTDHNHRYDDPDHPGRPSSGSTPPRSRIGAGCWLGTGVVVLPGTTLGRNVVVAAGSVVRGEVPDHAVVAGVPAEVIRRYADGEWDPPPRPAESPLYYFNTNPPIPNPLTKLPGNPTSDEPPDRPALS